MKPVNLLFLADLADDLLPVKATAQQAGLACTWELALSAPACARIVEGNGIDGIVSLSRLWGGDVTSLVLSAPWAARLPVVVLSSSSEPEAGHSRAAELLRAGAIDVVPCDEIWRLAPALDHLITKREREGLALEKERRAAFIHIVEQLSLARSMEAVMVIVRTAARQLTQADGATFVLRDKGHCFYADEDAVAPLWKGQRFPLSQCVSGWAMVNRKPAVIDDVFNDPRVPVSVYEPTFVRSMVMVPIRTQEPIGAIGTYWARKRQATEEEVELLQALADTTSVAIENVQLQEGLERRVRERTEELMLANEELEAFSSSVSHDLRNPLNAIDGFSALLEMDLAQQSEAQSRQQLGHVREAARRMGAIINDLLTLARAGRGPLHRDEVDLSAIAREVLTRLARAEPDRRVEVRVAPGLRAQCDAGLARIALENLLSNAWKYSSKKSLSCIEFDVQSGNDDGRDVFFVRDNGAGFDPGKAAKLFRPFQRLHPESEFTGVGVGLTTVRRVAQRHGGEVWATAAPGEGATFFFTLERAQPRPDGLDELHVVGEYQTVT